MNMDAEYASDGSEVKIGDKTIIYKCKHGGYDCTTDFVYPLSLYKCFFGPVMAFINDAGSGYGVYESFDLSELDPDKKILTNYSYLEPQGNMYLHSITFAHMARETSPFKDIILSIGINTQLYQKDAVWTENSVTFKPTILEDIHHDYNSYIGLDVLPPVEPITGIWFNRATAQIWAS